MQFSSKHLLISLIVCTSILFSSCGVEQENLKEENSHVRFDPLFDQMNMPLQLPIKGGVHVIVDPPSRPQPPRINEVDGLCSSVYVEWQEESNAERYFIKYRDESGYEVTEDAEDLDPFFTYGEVMNVTIPDLLEDEEYDICVMAWNPDGMSACNDGHPTDEYGWQFGIEALGLGIPSGLALSSDGETINMVWSRVACADDGYNIEIEIWQGSTLEGTDTEFKAQTDSASVTFSYSGIEGKTYKVRVKPVGGDESTWCPQEVITLEGAEIGLNTTEFNIECLIDQVLDPQILRISNEGFGTLHWTSSVSTGDESWLGHNPSFGYVNSSDYMNTNVNVTCSNAGMHNGTITITNVDSGHMREVDVTLTVLDDLDPPDNLRLGYVDDNVIRYVWDTDSVDELEYSGWQFHVYTTGSEIDYYFGSPPGAPDYLDVNYANYPFAQWCIQVMRYTTIGYNYLDSDFSDPFCVEPAVEGPARIYLDTNEITIDCNSPGSETIGIAILGDTTRSWNAYDGNYFNLTPNSGSANSSELTQVNVDPSNCENLTNPETTQNAYFSSSELTTKSVSITTVGGTVFNPIHDGFTTANSDCYEGYRYAGYILSCDSQDDYVLSQEANGLPTVHSFFKFDIGNADTGSIANARLNLHRNIFLNGDVTRGTRLYLQKLSYCYDDADFFTQARSIPISNSHYYEFNYDTTEYNFEFQGSELSQGLNCFKIVEGTTWRQNYFHSVESDENVRPRLILEY